ncbi:RNA exonuclease 4-like [Penaeus monodon]|uniref:RNA exonuclease 4-like n=1 Tax=Penaeus monodon TaxID=6687 RepID=UPI0018A7BE55|nr:RNA exonuclease 4-like [Penaeus monodon]XP_037778549.1 RNA exonuclease 4-like [Penaeus monodon]XP_037778550.1 RNA exonuclease 4-like [Penaeus monodon]
MMQQRAEASPEAADPRGRTPEGGQGDAGAEAAEEAPESMTPRATGSKSNDMSASSLPAAEESSVDEYAELTDALAIDCEMVGAGQRGRISMLARVSVVNEYGVVLLDKYIKPWKKVVDYRTKYSGIREADLKHGEDFGHVRKQVLEMLKGRILVGHALKHDLQALSITHPRALTRDTSMYKGFRNKFEGKTPSLKKLSMKFLGMKIQEGEHNSVEDAQATMSLYMLCRKQWDPKQKKRNSAVKEYYKYEPRKEVKRTNVASTSYFGQVNKLSKLPSFETRIDKNIEIVTINGNHQELVKEKDEEKAECEGSELKKGQSANNLSTLGSNVIQTEKTNGSSIISTPGQQKEI